MAEGKEKSISVLIPTTNYKELSIHYLPQLCAHLEECGDTLAGYEIVVSESARDLDGPETEENPLPNVRLLHTKPSFTEIENLNHALYAATKNYVLILGQNILPTHSYFKELFQLFNQVPSLFGVSGNTLMSNGGYNVNGVRTLDHESKAIKLVCKPLRSVHPAFTLTLSPTNMLIDRRYLCLMGGFCELFTTTEGCLLENGISAWRAGRKCLYHTLANCKLLATEDGEACTAEETGNPVYDQLLISYLHTNGFAYLKFRLKVLLTYIKICVTSKNDSLTTNAYYKFVKDCKGRITRRLWMRQQRNEPFEKIVKGYFSGKIIEINITEKH